MVAPPGAAATVAVYAELRPRRWPPPRSTSQRLVRGKHRAVRDRLGAGFLRTDAGDLRCDHRAKCADVDEAAAGAGRLVDGGVFDAPLLDPRAKAARHRSRQDRWSHRGNSAADWSFAPRRDRPAEARS